MRYILIAILILFSLIVFSQKDSVIIEMKKFPSGKNFPINNMKYLKVGNFIYNRTDHPNYQSENSIYSQEKSKLFYCIFDDSNNLLRKYEIKTTVAVLRYSFNPGDSVVLNAESKQMVGPDSCLPKLINVHSLSFVKNGKFLEFYTNGNIKVKGKFIINSKEGKWKYYSENGKLIERKKFIKGKEKGIEAPVTLDY